MLGWVFNLLKIIAKSLSLNGAILEQPCRLIAAWAKNASKSSCVMAVVDVYRLGLFAATVAVTIVLQYLLILLVAQLILRLYPYRPAAFRSLLGAPVGRIFCHFVGIGFRPFSIVGKHSFILFWICLNAVIALAGSLAAALPFLLRWLSLGLHARNFNALRGAMTKQNYGYREVV